MAVGLAEGTGSFILLGGKFPSALPQAAKVAHAMDHLQLLLNGLCDVHVIWDVDVTDITARYEEVIQLSLMPPPVRVGDLGQADVHESIDIVYASMGHTLIPQVHSGDLALEALQQDDQAVLRDGPFLPRVAHRHVPTLLAACGKSTQMAATAGQRVQWTTRLHHVIVQNPQHRLPQVCPPPQFLSLEHLYEPGAPCTHFTASSHHLASQVSFILIS